MSGWASRNRQYRQGPHALSAMYEHSFDIGRCGGASIERCIMSEPKFRAPIGVMEIHNDIRRIEQDNNVLREIGEGIDLQIALAQEHRSSLGNGEGSAHNGEIDIGQVPGRADPLKVTIANDLRY